MKKTIIIDICDNCNLETHDTADCPDRYPGAVAGTYEEWRAKRDADGEREAAQRLALPDPVTLTGEEVAELRRMLVFMTLGGLAPPAAQSAWQKLGLKDQEYDFRVSAAATKNVAVDSASCMACGCWNYTRQ
jgi:hypothetical protein